MLILTCKDGLLIYKTCVTKGKRLKWRCRPGQPERGALGSPVANAAAGQHIGQFKPSRGTYTFTVIFQTFIYTDGISYPASERSTRMITSAQMRAARALLGVDQRQLAEMARLSLPTIQRMEASDGQVRGIIDTLMKVVEALERAGVELIPENSPSVGVGRGVRLREIQPREAISVMPPGTGNVADGVE